LQVANGKFYLHILQMANGNFYLQFLPSKILVTNFAHHIMKVYSYFTGGKWKI
jgi:hypothetical protein